MNKSSNYSQSGFSDGNDGQVEAIELLIILLPVENVIHTVYLSVFRAEWI